MFFILMILLAGNLNALVDAVFQPEIPYFAEAHLVDGFLDVAFTGGVFLLLFYYVTRLKMAAATTRESEERFRTLAAQSPNMVFIKQGGRVVYANERFAEVMGYSRDDLLSPDFDFLTLIGPESQGLVRDTFRQHLNGGDIITSECSLLTRARGKVEVIITLKLIDFHGDPGILGTMTDITARKRAEAELQIKDAAMAESINGIVLVNPQGEITYVNCAMLTLWGYDKKSGMVGRSALDLWANREEATRVTTVLHDTGGWVGELVAQREDGSRFDVELATSLVHDHDGTFLGTMGSFIDITTRKKAEEGLRQFSGRLEALVAERTAELDLEIAAHKGAETEIRKLNEEQRQYISELEEARILAEAGVLARSEFLANMSHELTTPLNAIIGFSQVMLDDIGRTLSAQQREYLQTILESGKRLNETYSEILQLSGLNSGELKLLPATFRVNDLLETALLACNEKAVCQGVTLALELDLPPGLEIEADRRKLQQVLANLLDNGVKFTGSGGSVRVAARLTMAKGEEEAQNDQRRTQTGQSALGPAGCHPTCLVISVADTGIGMTEEEQARLFKPFQQLEPVYTKKYKGLGAGLLVAKKMIELHDGRLWVKSGPGTGSTFTFEVPMSQTVIQPEQEARK
jgi:PAS domain S-box-containing protein